MSPTPGPPPGPPPGAGSHADSDLDGSDVRAAAGVLGVALRTHLDAVERSTGEMDPLVKAAFLDLREAFLVYDELLFEVHDEVLPVEVVEYVDDEDDGDEDPAGRGDDDLELVEL